MISAQHIQKIGVSLAIVIVLNLFFNYGVYTFYKPPVFDRFCGQELQLQPATAEACQNIGGRWNAVSPSPSSEQVKPVPVTPTGYCDATYTCSQQYTAVNDIYSRNVFIVLVVLGLAAIVAGVMLTSSSVVAGGLLYGGVLSLVIGSIRYWSNMDDILRFVILGLTLAILLVIGYRKMADQSR